MASFQVEMQSNRKTDGQSPNRNFAVLNPQSSINPQFPIRIPQFILRHVFVTRDRHTRFAWD